MGVPDPCRVRHTFELGLLVSEAGHWCNQQSAATQHHWGGGEGRRRRRKRRGRPTFGPRSCQFPLAGCSERSNHSQHPTRLPFLTCFTPEGLGHETLECKFSHITHSPPPTYTDTHTHTHTAPPASCPIIRVLSCPGSQKLSSTAGVLQPGIWAWSHDGGPLSRSELDTTSGVG